jgi:ABC-type sugar transport system ATPase subunit
MLQITGLKKTYADRQVLRIDELTIKKGETLALIGPNGAGKSTLLRLLHFLEPWDEGEIRYEGTVVEYPADLLIRRDFAMVFQRPVLFNGTVRENIRYGLWVRGQSDPKRVDRVIGQLHLAEFATEHVKNISGGELQRVAIAQALVVESKILLLDEPIANMDPYSAALIEDIIQTAQKERDLTVVIVSHHVAQALRLADRVAVVYAGELLELAQADQFIEEVKDPRTQAYLAGTMVSKPLDTME